MSTDITTKEGVGKVLVVKGKVLLIPCICIDNGMVIAGSEAIALVTSDVNLTTTDTRILLTNQTNM